MIDHFPSRIIGYFEENGSGRYFTLTEAFTFVDGDETIVVPAGFRTDFNSVPRLAWAYFSPWDHLEAGVVHDWLYKTPGNRNRTSCDAVHRRILHLKGVRWSKRQVVWASIRAGGWVPWNRYRQAETTTSSMPSPGDHN